MHLKCKMSSSPLRRGVGGIYDNRSDPICSQLPAWHLQAQQPKGKQISAAFQQVVMVISPMVKTQQDHGQTRAWCRDHDRSFLEKEPQLFGGGKEKRASFAS